MATNKVPGPVEGVASAILGGVVSSSLGANRPQAASAGASKNAPNGLQGRKSCVFPQDCSANLTYV